MLSSYKQFFEVEYIDSIETSLMEEIGMYEDLIWDDQGRCSPSGKAIVLRITSLMQLVEYVNDMSQSISSSLILSFEITHVLITASDIASQNISPLDPVNSTFSLNTNVSVPQQDEDENTNLLVQGKNTNIPVNLY